MLKNLNKNFEKLDPNLVWTPKFKTLNKLTHKPTLIPCWYNHPGLNMTKEN